MALVMPTKKIVCFLFYTCIISDIWMFAQDETALNKCYEHHSTGHTERSLNAVPCIGFYEYEQSSLNHSSGVMCSNISSSSGSYQRVYSSMYSM